MNCPYEYEVNNMNDVRILSAGERGLVIEFGNKIDPVVNRKVHDLSKLLKQWQDIGIHEVVPTYRSLLVYFDPLVLSRQELTGKIDALLSQGGEGVIAAAETRLVTIPVCYGGEYGPDIAFVAEHSGLSETEVITIHTSTPYLVYMLGFTPGFPYLGGMSDKIATPRLKQPRTAIPAGSVGIAGNQTGFYPVQSPGGWQLIGQTPVKGFDPRLEQPFLLSAGDYVQFQSITAAEFEAIGAEAAGGTYRPAISQMRKGGAVL